jgi:hypothetical protein
MCLLVSTPAPAQEPQSPQAAPSQAAPSERALLGKPAAITLAVTPMAALPADTPLFAEPERTAPVLLVLDVPAEVEVLERGDAWLRVRHAGVAGWVRLGDDGAPEPWRPAERPAPPDPRRRSERLSTARELLRGQGGPDRGDGALWITDLPSRSPLLRRLSEIASCLPSLHRERYGLRDAAAAGPADPASPPPAFVVFARERDYREYVERMGELDAYETGGHAADGVAVLYAGERDPDDVAAVFAHELVHVLDARAFPFALPAWVEEGMAEDFALATAGSEGCPEPGAWPRLRRSEHEVAGSGRTTTVTRWRASGEGRTAACAARDWEAGAASPALEELVDLPREELSEPAGRARRYVAAAGLVRVLVDGGAERRAAFAELLARWGSGEGADLRAAVQALGTPLAALERELVALLAGRLDPRLCDPRVAE